MLLRLLAGILLCWRALAGPLAAVPLTRSCPPGCTDHGNCDAETGTCECMFGFGGPDCSQRLMPACHNAPDLKTSIPAFGHFFPKNCFCHKQLAVAGCPRPFFREPQNCYYFQFWTWQDTFCYVLKASLIAPTFHACMHACMHTALLMA
ncbi:hypothetical protein TSOC_012044 [Tetrabaena socialis]|uniref:EGF-like domain-containing protein n=1 Tax=Tetrabaena socialis TaxID=47790 RepID=A0A2J7ZP14_9CHLO|nr:hypothetical protein TSOC_012044 [Tetrabaena socialis]|eukprot:PNH02014.1 hypothetical protein TSOC_012044 [Tetrabaena socialis]